MRLKITLFFTYGVSLDLWAKTGLLNREILLYKKLISRYDVSVQFITYGDKSDLELKDALGDITILPVYSRMPYRKIKILRLFQSLLIPFYFSKELKTTDILKTNQMLGGWTALISKLFFHKPLLTRCGYEIFDAYRFQMANGLRKRSKSVIFIVWLMSFLTYRFSDAVHVATLEDSKIVSKYFKVPPSRIEVRPNWLDLDVFKNKSYVRKKNRILFVGRLNAQKNIFLLLKALSGTNISIDIVGEGVLEKDLRIYAKNKDVNANFLGSFENNKMPEIYNSYLVYVLCSPYEGNPKTLLEAMACGCAVIGTNVSGIQSIISNQENGLLVNEDFFSLRSAILDLINNKKKQNKLVNNANKYIKFNNSLDMILTKEFEAYNKIKKI